MSRQQADDVALANDGHPDPAWTTWAKNCLASGAIVPPRDWQHSHFPWLGACVLALVGIGGVLLWLSLVPR